MPSRAALGFGVALALGALGAAAQPAAGRSDGELCVAVADATPGCGPAQLRLQRGGLVQVRVGDIEYRLQLHSSQLDLMLMHGTMQIDGFTANYEWQGRVLLFRDPDKAVVYRVRVGNPS